MGATTVVATAKAIEKVVEDIYALASGEVKDRIKRWRTVHKINSLYRKLSIVRKVKTIWQIESHVDLLSFYYPSRILTSQGRKAIQYVKDLDTKGNVLIEGTVGQGKSIFLRYLCVQELYRGEVIPLFMELRRLEVGTSLKTYIFESLDILGISVDDRLFDYLASSGKLLICLDGFDEVKESQRSTLISQIEVLSAKYENLKFIVTSRPDNAIDKSPFFRVIRLAPLQRPEIRGVIDKLVNDASFTDELTAAIDKNKGDIRNLLTTPLMVTLLVIAYRAEQKIPETLAEFYESLFNTLLLRHDRLKAGFNRQRKSGLGDRAIRSVFDALSFLCRKQQLTTISQDQLYDVCVRAFVAAQIQNDPQAYIDDLKHITCLLLEEGGTYHFIHKSVAEFHSASFIKHRPDEGATKFYQHIFANGHSNWSQELEFLSQIDRFRFCRDFLIPDIRRLVGPVIDTPSKHPDAVFQTIYKFVSGHYVGTNEHGQLRTIKSTFDVQISSWALDQASDRFYDAIIRANWGESAKRYGKPIADNPEKKGQLNAVVWKIDLDKVLTGSLAEPRGQLLLACRRMSESLEDIYKQSVSFVQEVEATKKVFDDLC
jgi:NACHT domain